MTSSTPVALLNASPDSVASQRTNHQSPDPSLSCSGHHSSSFGTLRIASSPVWGNLNVTVTNPLVLYTCLLTPDSPELCLAFRHKTELYSSRQQQTGVENQRICDCDIQISSNWRVGDPQSTERRRMMSRRRKKWIWWLVIVDPSWQNVWEGFKKNFSLWTFTKTVAIESESEIYPSGGPNSQDPKQALGPGTVLVSMPPTTWDRQSVTICIISRLAPRIFPSRSFTLY